MESEITNTEQEMERAMKSRKAIIRDQGAILRHCTELYSKVDHDGQRALTEINQTAKATIELLKYQEAEKRCADCKYVKVRTYDLKTKEYVCYRPLRTKHNNPTYAGTVDPDWYCKDWVTFEFS